MANIWSLFECRLPNIHNANNFIRINGKGQKKKFCVILDSSSLFAYDVFDGANVQIPSDLN